MASFLLLILASILLPSAQGHGRVMEPVSRASAWRKHFPVPIDYDDNGVNCGGFARQWLRNLGKCGICGDAYDIKPPRPHEIGGKYGKGIIVAKYKENALITTIVELTTSHLGFWEFRICPDPKKNKQSCFDKFLLKTKNGATKFYPILTGTYKVVYRLPKGLSCKHCVLQWKYTAGNNWGPCGNGTFGKGCGPQETFGACSDIQIGGNDGSGKGKVTRNFGQVENVGSYKLWKITYIKPKSKFLSYKKRYRKLYKI